ncbi:MAG: hypothetical protein IPM32_04275 [Ignavibacteriae bacterium]|nr:hypothetical protein [Ignavibacteriota bacterium]
MKENIIPISKLAKQNWKYLIVIFLVTEFLILLTNKIDYSNSLYSNSDFNKYILMAEASPQLNQEVIRPFVYRIVVPWLAGLLPFSIINNFVLLNHIALLFLAFSVFLFLLDNNVGIKLSFFLTLTFQLNRYFFLYNTWNYFQVGDVISLGILFLSFLLLKRKNWILLFLIFPISVLIKEYVLLFLPAGFVYLFLERTSAKNYIIYFILSLSSILVYVLIRMIIFSEGGESLYVQYTTQVIYFSKPILLIKRFIVPFTPFGLIPIIFFRETILFFRKHFYFLIFSITVMALSFFGEPERLMAPLSVAFILFLFDLLKLIFNEIDERKFKLIFVVIYFLIVFTASFYHIWGIITLPTKELSMIFTIMVNVLMAILFLVFKNFSKFKIKLF